MTEDPTNATEQKRILVVDDRPSDTKLVKHYLEQTNEYVVREENDATAALAAALEFRPHLILLDLLMPELDGGDLAASFQAEPALQNVPIVFLTALVTKDEVRAGGGQAGKYPFLAKPVVLPELLAFIRKRLAG